MFPPQQDRPFAPPNYRLTIGLPDLADQMAGVVEYFVYRHRVPVHDLNHVLPRLLFVGYPVDTRPATYREMPEAGRRVASDSRPTISGGTVSETQLQPMTLTLWSL
jgi:hypothetical protein